MSREPPPPSDLPRGVILPPTEANVALAAAFLRAGDVVGMPTETVYGLAADATDGEAVARIYEAKGRPSFNPLICHVTSLEEAERYAVFNDAARTLAQRFWPGPLTLVLPSREGSPISDLARAGLPTVALRVPAHAAARALIGATGRPIAAPSANLSGRISPTTARHVASDLGPKVAAIIDGGPCEAGLESTILGWRDSLPILLRHGAIPADEIELDALTAQTLSTDGNSVISPGQLLNHYAPIAQMQLNCDVPAPNSVFLSFGPLKCCFDAAITPVIPLSRAGELRECAARLFAAMREADALGPGTICVAPIPDHGLGVAINDRLRRAAAASAV